MKELISNIIQTLGGLDVILNSASLILAIAAIIASVKVAGTQNRIALFNIRYDAYFELNCLLDFAQILRDNSPEMSQQPQPKQLLMEISAFNAEFATDLCLASYKSPEDQASKQVKMLMAVRSIEKTIKASLFVADDLDEREMESLLNALRRYLTQVIIGGTDYYTERESFITRCATFKDQHFDKAVTKARLYSSFQSPFQRKKL